MVLILVDGNCTVGELCEKAGNQQMVESALQDLERDGLIVPKLEQDSVWEQSRKLAEEIKAAAMNRLAKDLPKEAPIIAPSQPAAAQPVPFSVAPLSTAPFSTFGGQMPMSTAPFSTFGGQSVAPQEPPPPPPAVEPPRPKGFVAGLVEKLRPAPPDDDGIGPIKKGGSKTYISWPLALAIGVVSVVLLVAVIFVMYPYDSHRPQMEAMLGRLTGQQVRIGNVQAELMPKPAIVLSRISGADDGALEIARIRLVPELFSLFGSRPVFSSVEIDGGHVSERVLSRLPQAVSDSLAGTAGMLATSVRFSELEVEVLGLAVSGLQSEIRLNEKGAAGPLALISSDRSFKASVRGEGGGFVADIEALAWKPAETRFQFDSLQAQLVWNGQQLAVRSLDARIFDGSIQGVLTLDRQSGQPGMAGDLAVKHMNLSRMGEAFGYGRQYEGDLAGTLRFGARAASWAQVLPSAVGEGTFTLNRGALGGMDLVEAVRRGKSPVRGGATRYEQLTGNLKISPESIQFVDLALTSGLLKAGGTLGLAPEARLTGRFDVEMRGSANLVRMPVTVSGSLKDPVLQGGR